MKSHILPVLLLCGVCYCGCGKSQAPDAATTAADKSAGVESITSASSILQPLGVRPSLGRDFVPQDFLKGSPAVAIISSELFAAAYGSRPDVVGQKIHAGDQDLTIVGVAPMQPATLQGRKVWIAQQK